MSSHSTSSWFIPKTYKNKPHIRINSIAIYNTLASQISEKIDQNVPIDDIIQWLVNECKKAYQQQYNSNPKTGSLNNAIGRWNEYILITIFSKISLEINKNNQFCLTIFPIPNSSPNKKIAILELLNEQALDKIANFQDRIFMSSPDLICVIRQTDNLSNNLEELIRQQAENPQSLEIYNFFKGKLSGEDIKAIFSVKTSYRPDRRYQPLFEAAIIKSISYVLDQSWHYYMISNELSQADINLFKSAISPHGIILQENLRLIDETFLLSTPQDLKPIILKILDYYQNNLS